MEFTFAHGFDDGLEEMLISKYCNDTWLKQKLERAIE